MDYKQELINQIEILKKTQQEALACQQYDTVNAIASNLYGFLEVLKNA